MDPPRAHTGRRGGSPTKQGATNANDTTSPEQLLEAFRAAALSVTKLYKTSAAVETRARADGYQDCLDDLLAFLDRENMGLGDGEGWKVRQWATERLDGREPPLPESEDEAEKGDQPMVSVSPEISRATVAAPPQSATTATTTSTETTTTTRNEREVPTRTETPLSPHIVATIVEPPVSQPSFMVPSQDVFTFQSSQPYPQLEKLDLSDSRPHDGFPTHSPSSTPSSRQSRKHGGGLRGNGRSGQLGRGAGQKRKINLGEIFDLGSLGYGKDPFGTGGKRSRHA